MLRPHLFSTLFIALFALSLTACGGDSTSGTTDGKDSAAISGKPDPSATENPPAASPPDESEIKDPPHPLNTLADFDVLVVGKGLRTRENPNTSAKVVSKLEFGQLLRSEKHSEKRDVVTEGDACDGYGWWWHEVEHEDQKSWAYGKFLFEVQADQRAAKDAYENAKIWGQKVHLEGKNYTFGGAYDFSYGTSDQDGLTGCDALMLPFLYEEGKNSAYPIYFDESRFDAPDLDFKNDRLDAAVLFLMAGSEGGSDVIESLNDAVTWNGDPAVEINVVYYYQDGSRKAKIYIGKVGDRFEVIGYQADKVEF